MPKPKFVPTDAMVQAAENVFFAMAFKQTIEAVVLAYQRAVLQQGQWSIEPNRLAMMQRRHHGPDPIQTIILDPKDDYLMSEADSAVCYAAYERERKLSGLKVERDGNCPLLEAKSLLSAMENKLIEAMEPITHISLDKILSGRLDRYRELVELTLRLLGPFVDSEAMQKKLAEAHLNHQPSQKGHADAVHPA